MRDPLSRLFPNVRREVRVALDWIFTIGGAIAADVHGKNHHHGGSFGSYVESLQIALADGSVREVSPTDDAELFWATVGGLGLTGVIVEATVRLLRVPSAWMLVTTERSKDLDGVLAVSRAMDGASFALRTQRHLLAGEAFANG